ncbi:hypothetical protein [Jeongeupia naejangsanensis]|uniref:Uncharacterized protein n=1 Tax=Jeongeupia naejangsanensis TaxID=613195 RepID=A0ABS2BHL5_9NEIS|nr:hypothetical protein [Jeongeupia naejangsanensis]MBM3115106.1 hypothetical protein [Jeongeupia naejangsanensis]
MDLRQQLPEYFIRKNFFKIAYVIAFLIVAALWRRPIIMQHNTHAGDRTAHRPTLRAACAAPMKPANDPAGFSKGKSNGPSPPPAGLADRL